MASDPSTPWTQRLMGQSQPGDQRTQQPWTQQAGPAADKMVQVSQSKLMELIAKMSQASGIGQPQGGLPPEQGDAMAQGQAPQPGGAPMGPPMPPGTGQQGLMARGSPAIQPNSGAMPFMGGGGPAQGPNPMTAMASAQQRPQYATTTRATVPDLGQPPTVEDAISMASSIAPAGGLKSDLIMKSFDFLNNQYKSQTADKLKVYEQNIQQAGGLNQEQTALANSQNRSGNEQFTRAMQLAQLGDSRGNEQYKRQFQDRELGLKTSAEDRRLKGEESKTAVDSAKVDMERVRSAQARLVDARARYQTATDKGTEGGGFFGGKPTPDGPVAAQAKQDIADAESQLRGGGSSPQQAEGGPIKIPKDMTPDQVRKKYKSGTEIILPDGSPGVVP